MRAKEVDVLANLEEVFEIPVHRVDERRLSTWRSSTGKKTVRRKKQKPGKIKALAAGLILSDFL